MLDDDSGNPPGTDPDTRGQSTEADDSLSAVIGATSDHGSDGDGNDRGLINVGLESDPDPDPSGRDSFSVGFGDTFGNDDADEHELGLRASSEGYGALDVELSPWAPLLAMLDSTEPEESLGDRPFSPSEGVERAHALELRAESMLQYCERGAERSGELDRTEVGVSDDNRDVVAGRDQAEIDGMLEEHTGHGLVHVADDVEMNVGGSLRMHAHLEDNIIMSGVMRDEFAGGAFIAAAMSDDMAAVLGLRCTAPLDLWVHGLVGMEERPGTCAADGILLELAGTLYEREFGPSAHAALVARHSGTVVTTMKTRFRPLMNTALGVRNLIPGGGGGGGGASTSPPAAPPAPGGGEAAGAVTLTAAESGGALGRGAAGSDDTDEIVSVARTVENASDTADIEDLQHPASTADNLDDLARVEVEGTGYQQVAEIYEQPVVDPSPGSGSAASGSAGREPPPLDLTEPGAEGYDFGKAYGSLSDRNRFYRGDSNWRGNIYMREYLSEIDSKAAALLTDVGGSADGIAGDSFGFRTSNIYAKLETMAGDAEMAGRLDDLADIRGAMDELEGLVNGTLVDVAARTDEFSGAALGAQRVPIDPNIDTDKLRSWLDEQLLKTQEKFMEAEAIVDPAAREKAVQDASWEAAYWVQLINALDGGVSPLSDSSEQIALIRVEKVDPYYAAYADDAATAAAEGYVLVIPRPRDEDQLDLFLDLQDRLLGTVSDPEFFRSAEQMGADPFTAALHNPIDPGSDFPGPDLPGPDSVHPPDHPAADPSPGAGPAAPGPAAREPTPLDLTEPGAEGYDFRNAYGSLNKRNQFYREEFNFRGNFFMREYLQEIDTKAFALFEGVNGKAAAIEGDNFGHRTSSIYRTLETMAEQADAAGDVIRATDYRAAMAEIDGLVNSTLADVVLRTDEFSGAAIGSQRAPIDCNIDTEMLRNWLQDQEQQAHAKLLAADDVKAQQLATWEWGYYVQLIRSLDEGVNPLATSNEQIAVMQINKVDPYYAAYADEVAAAAEDGYVLVIARPQAEDEVDLYVKLQELLVATLSDPQFHRSAEEMGADAYTASVRSRIEARLDFLGPDSLRPLGGGDIPPPLPAADFADSAGYVDEVRDRSFSRSSLAASEETLQRQVAGLAEGDASVRSREATPGTGSADLSLGSRRAPPDNAPAPLIDERTGRWVVDPTAQPDASPVPADDASPPVHGEGTASQTSGVSWESGLQASGDSEAGSEVGLGAGNAGDTDTSDLFRAAPEPEVVDPEGVDEVQHARAANDDGVSGSPIARSVGTGGEDANPTGTVSGTNNFSTASRRGDGTGRDPSRSVWDTASRFTSSTADPVSTGTPRSAPGTDATPAGASASDAGEGTAGTRSDLYNEPVSFEGRSLEGVPLSDDSKELAQSLDGAEIPIEDLPPVEPDAAEPRRKSICRNADAMSDPGISYRDEDDAIIERRTEYAKNTRSRSSRNADTVWRRARNRKDAVDAANTRWSKFASATRTSSTSFSDDPRQTMFLVEYETTTYTDKGEKIADVYRGIDSPNTLDRSHAAHYVPRPWGWKPEHETGFGRLSLGWNEFPFSHRERILNSLSKGESLSPEQNAALESGLEGYRAAGGRLSSSQYRAMVDMISDLRASQYRMHARWHMRGWRRQRLLQLIEMLDYAAVVT